MILLCQLALLEAYILPSGFPQRERSLTCVYEPRNLLLNVAPIHAIPSFAEEKLVTLPSSVFPIFQTLYEVLR